MNLIYCDFSPDFKDQIISSFQAHGIVKTRLQLIAHGYHPSFVGGLIKYLVKRLRV